MGKIGEWARLGGLGGGYARSRQPLWRHGDGYLFAARHWRDWWASLRSELDLEHRECGWGRADGDHRKHVALSGELHPGGPFASWHLPARQRPGQAYGAERTTNVA